MASIAAIIATIAGPCLEKRGRGGYQAGMSDALISGLIAGWGVAIPLGAIGVLLVDLGMRAGFRHAAPAAAAVATADLLYAGGGGARRRGGGEPARAARARDEADRRRCARCGRGREPARLAGGRAAADAGAARQAPLRALPRPHGGQPDYGRLLRGADRRAARDRERGRAGQARVRPRRRCSPASAGSSTLAGSGAALHHRLPESARLWTALAGNALVLGLALRMALSA